jgi:RNA polymerase sigma-70 factor (sigma-E family)
MPTPSGGTTSRAPREPGRAGGTGARQPDAAESVTALYAEHALGLVRLAVIMLGDQQAAEDAVQDAFLGLYRRWSALADPAKALPYVRSAVLNGCRNALRHRERHAGRALELIDRPGLSCDPAADGVLLGEEHAAVLAAIRRLPARQREALILRYYLEMPEADAAATMGVSVGTVKSSTSRAITALGKMLKELP